MFKKRSYSLSLFILLFSALFLIVNIGHALAATENTVLSVPNVTKGETKKLGILRIAESGQGLGVLAPGQPITVYLPEGVTYTSVATGATLDKYVSPGVTSAVYNRLTQADISLVSAGAGFLTISCGGGSHPGNPATLDFNFEVNIDEDFSGDIKVKIEAPGSAVTEGQVLVARVVTSGTNKEVLEVPVLAYDAANATVGRIKVTEKTPGSLAVGKKITLTAPKGVTFGPGTSYIIVSGWQQADLDENFTFEYDTDGLHKASLAVKNATGGSQQGVLIITPYYNLVNVKPGELKIKIDGVEKVNAKVAGNAVNVKGSGEPPVVFAGRKEASIGTVSLTEDAPGTLLLNRTVTLTLPQSITWSKAPTVTTKGGIKISAGQISGSRQAATYQVEKFSAKPSTVEFSSGKVCIPADTATGDLKLAVAGSVGARGETVVARVYRPVDVEVEKVQLKIGLQEQAGSDIVIKETKEGALLKGKLVIAVPAGVTFAQKPGVSVTQGDLELDQAGVYLEELAGRSNRLVVSIAEASTKASTVKLANCRYTVNRSVPDGEMKFSVGGGAVVEPGSGDARELMEATFAVCGTPAPGETRSAASFTIGKKMYRIGGVEKEMDVDPYIKDDRTFGPVRYIAYALGLSDQDIVWDEASQTVTLMRGNRVVQLCAGRIGMIVQGAEITMDAAPEMALPGRMMLPYRWVAQALGGKVEWNPDTLEVIIQAGQ